MGIGLERILALAATDAAVEQRLAEDSGRTADELGICLTITERRILATITPAHLQGAIDGVRHMAEGRRAFLMGAGATGLLALATGCEGPRVPKAGIPPRDEIVPKPDASVPDSRPTPSNNTSSMYFGELQVSDGREGGGTGEGTIGLGTLGTITGTRPGAKRKRPRFRSILGEPTVKGRLSAQVVRRIVRRHLNELRYCFQRSYPREGAKLMLAFTITRTGEVFAPTALVDPSRRFSRRSEACAAKAVGRWRFPKPRDGREVDVVMKVTFEVLAD